MDINRAKRNITRAWLFSVIAIPASFVANNTRLFMPWDIGWFMPWDIDLPAVSDFKFHASQAIQSVGSLLIILFLTFLAYKKSRAGAILLFILYVLNKAFTFIWLYIFSTAFIIIWLRISLLWGFIFFQGIRGTFAYHGLRQKINQNG